MTLLFKFFISLLNFLRDLVRVELEKTDIFPIFLFDIIILLYKLQTLVLLLVRIDIDFLNFFFKLKNKPITYNYR